MRFGIAFANVGPFIEPHAAASFARAAEDAGFESLWTVEHVVVPSDYKSPYPYSPDGRMPGTEDSPIPDPLIWLAYVAASTERIRLGTGILILPQRNPIVLAKELATLDRLSGGRLLLGVGIGWLEEEFDAIGVPFGDRAARTDEYVSALRTLWTEDKATFHGEYANFDNCILRPRPTQGLVPVHVGGHSQAAARRAGRLGDGFFPAGASHDRFAGLLEIARAEAAAAGRDPGALEISFGGNGAFGPNALDEVKALADLGVDRVIIPAFVFWRDPAGDLARYGDDVIARAR
jgi:probable F420-dependent oxidoreductase